MQRQAWQRDVFAGKAECPPRRMLLFNPTCSCGTVLEFAENAF